ncbi:MAG: transcription elongation factor GreA [Clostridia bacterium]|nr:transcription elongation factor GreA [Clostridia bacterium]
MAAKQTVITEEGLKKLENELDELKTIKRKEVAEKIKVALSFGDLSENSEYDEAKNEQAIIEGRIAEIENQLKNVHVLDENEFTTEDVHVGSVVTVRTKGKKTDVTYQIVGSTEADPLNGRISDESPIGKALIGHKAGDQVEAETPGGIVVLTIRQIAK